MCTTNNVHPFQETIEGSVGPYSFIGLIDFKESGAEALQHFRVVTGFCDHCGRPIRYNCVIEDSKGKRFVVGTSCVTKTGDRRVGTPMEVELKRLQRQARKAKADAKREAILNTVQESGKTLREEREEAYQAMLDQVQAQKNAVRIQWAEVLTALKGTTRGEFVMGMIQNLEEGCAPTGRAKQICLEIYAKQFGRKNSKAYNQAYDTMESQL